MHNGKESSTFLIRHRLCAIGLCLAALSSARGAQTDIAGPPGSASFGAVVKVLPNGNFVVVDTYGPVSGVGSVYLYSAKGTLISTLTGSSANDSVGNGGIYPVAGSNFVVASPYWNNGGAMHAGAVTWVNGTTGLNGVVSSANSLVGTTENDQVGIGGITTLHNGNYVVVSQWWNGDFGAVTWGSGSGGMTGSVSAVNSLVGSTTGDNVGYPRVTALANGNYVVSSNWQNGGRGAYVGAATWGDGAMGIAGTISAANSLVGSTISDGVGAWVVALTNGNYVVDSWNWHNGTGAQVGAVTWGNGATGIVGTPSASNSLVGTADGDGVGVGGTAALSDGNYAVGSRAWNGVGAATWGDGSLGTSGIVSAANSLVGTTAGDLVGGGITALKNGNYVVASPFWHNSGTANAGAATWVHGGGIFSGTVAASNSLVGTTSGDYVGGLSSGFGSITALSDGNYVVASSNWNNGTPGSHVGAVTWGDGTHGTSGVVSIANSLVGAVANDYAGAYVTALGNGSYVAASLYNDTDPAGYYGAMTWCRPRGITHGTISAVNSLVGEVKGDQIGSNLTYAATLFSDGNYAFSSPYWGNGQSYGQYGAITLASSRFRLKGTIASWNSVIGGVTDGGDRLNFDYDAARHRLIVGRPSENIVSLFTMDQMFADDFEP